MTNLVPLRPAGHNHRLAVEYLPPESLRPDPRNPRIISKRKIKAIARSIEVFHFNVPLLITAEGEIIAGQARWEAAKLLGMTEVPIIRLEHLDLNQRLGFMLADNKLSEGAWNQKALGEVFLHLSSIDLDFSLEDTGFSVTEIDLAIEEFNLDGDGEKVEEAPPDGPAVTKLGDRWRLGEHRIMCASALDPLAWVILMDGKLAALVVTDPPYNVEIDGHVSGLGKIKHREFAMASGEMSEAEFTGFLTDAMKLARDHSTAGSVHYWAMDWRHDYELITAGRSVYDRHLNTCVWAKTSPGMGTFYRSQHEFFFVFSHGKEGHRNNVQLGKFGRNRTNVWTYPGASNFGRNTDEGNVLAWHPTVKPLDLIVDILLDASARGDLVVDAFLGSGTTVIAAEKVGRVARGFELDPLYCDTIIRRWQRWTGEKAVRESDGMTFDDLEALAAVEQ